MQRVERKPDASVLKNQLKSLGRFSSVPNDLLINYIFQCLKENEKGQFCEVSTFFYYLLSSELIKECEYKQYSNNKMKLYNAKMEDELHRIVLVQKLWDNDWSVALDDHSLNICSRVNTTEKQTQFSIFKTTYKITQCNAKILNIVVLFRQDVWITQTENYEFFVWNRKNELISTHVFTPRITPNYNPICELFLNGKIMLVEENSIQIYDALNIKQEPLETKTAGLPEKTYYLEDGKALCYHNSLHRFDLEGNVTYKKECVLLQRNSRNAIVDLQSTTVSELATRKDFQGANILRLPYRQFADFYKSLNGPSTITFYSLNTKKQRKEKYTDSSYYNVYDSWCRLFAVRDGSVFLYSKKFSGFIDFESREPALK